MSRPLIQISDLSISFGSRLVFNKISLSVNSGDCFAVIGENGAGKSTLLRVLSGQLSGECGSIHRMSGITVGMLEQEIQLKNHEISVRQFLVEGPLLELEKRMSTLEERLDDPEALAEWIEIFEEYEQKGGFRHPSIEEMLHGLCVEVELDTPMSSLSSGQKVRVALAKVLIEDPDLLLLDEPTNHLDQAAISWLHTKLRHRKGATIIVSHDRRLLNMACNRLIELQHGHLTCYGGNYDFYLREKESFIERKMKAYEEQKEERSLLRQKIRHVSFSTPKPSPPSDRNVMAYDRRGEKHQKSKKRVLNELKAQLEKVERTPLSHPKPKGITGLYFTPSPLSSPTAILLEDIAKSFHEKTLFSGVTATVHKEDRIIIQGPNGCGKTTLLKCISGEISPSSGNIRYASTAKIAYLDQEGEALPLEKTPLEYFSFRFGLSEETLHRELHKAALGGGELLRRPCSTLSVGQRKRLLLLSLILEKPNILLLDEPTNHLDLETLEAFEKALLEFDGAIIAISHDKTFIQKIATAIWQIFPLR